MARYGRFDGEVVAEGTSDCGMALGHADLDTLDFPFGFFSGVDAAAVANEDVVQSFGSGVWTLLFNHESLALE